jgi:Predicted metal-dependent hydrolase
MNKNNSLNKLFIGNEIFEYSLKSGRRKSLEIKIKNDGQIYVSAPFYMSLKDIEDVLEKKSEWIRDKLHIIKQSANINDDLASMTNVPFMGRDIVINIRENNIKRVYVSFDDNYLNVDIPKGFQVNDRNILIKEYLKKFYKKYTEDYLKSKLSYYGKSIGVKFSDYKIKDQKSRWGSCSTKGNLNFNFRLSMAPAFVFDYIIVHELCHLLEMNHSQRFWELVKKYYPDYKEAKKWLKNNSQRLMFI